MASDDENALGIELEFRTCSLTNSFSSSALIVLTSQGMLSTTGRKRSSFARKACSVMETEPSGTVGA
jgi:hypothetical protein